MRITVAIDSFKGSLDTFDAANAVKDGIMRVFRDAEIGICPLADGGEGTVDAIIAATGGERVKTTVHNPLGKLITASYGIIPERKTAVIEMSAAAGITLIDEKDKNPLNTTTYGVGELIIDAISKGCRKFIVGIGSSATNDGGVGMLSALGFSFLDASGNNIPLGARGLREIASISTDGVFPELSECSFLVACDVKNVLCGENGASAVYGPQKGATPDMIKDMDLWLGRYADITKSIIPKADKNIPGTGAAGGMGFAFLSYLNATLESGVELVIKETELENYIESSDIVVTGEGRLDGQSVMGKAPIGVAQLAKKHNKPVIAFSGCVTKESRVINEYGIDAFFPILRTPCTVEDAMEKANASENLKDTAEQVFRLIKAGIVL